MAVTYTIGALRMPVRFSATGDDPLGEIFEAMKTNRAVEFRFETAAGGVSSCFNVYVMGILRMDVESWLLFVVGDGSETLRQDTITLDNAGRGEIAIGQE